MFSGVLFSEVASSKESRGCLVKIHVPKCTPDVTESESPGQRPRNSYNKGNLSSPVLGLCSPLILELSFKNYPTDTLLTSLYKEALSQKSSGKSLTITGVKCDKKDWAPLIKCREWVAGCGSRRFPNGNMKDFSRLNMKVFSMQPNSHSMCTRITL